MCCATKWIIEEWRKTNGDYGLKRSSSPIVKVSLEILGRRNYWRKWFDIWKQIHSNEAREQEGSYSKVSIGWQSTSSQRVRWFMGLADNLS